VKEVEGLLLSRTNVAEHLVAADATLSVRFYGTIELVRGNGTMKVLRKTTPVLVKLERSCQTDPLLSRYKSESWRHI